MQSGILGTSQMGAAGRHPSLLYCSGNGGAGVP